VKELTSDNTATFHFIQGPCQVTPPEGFEEFFGGAPYFRFIAPEKGDYETDVLDRIRDFPTCATPEDSMRELMKFGLPDGRPSCRRAMEYLYKIMDEQGPFEGIIGYSEGATVAATLLLHEYRRFELTGRPTMFKCALFFGILIVSSSLHFN
jgi:hypothetical protein